MVMMEMTDMPALPTFVSEHRLVIICLALCLFLFAHVFRFLHKHDWLFFMVIMSLAAICFVAFIFAPIVYIWDVLLIMAVYGITLYIVLCEVLLQGGAQWLTKKRGEKWIKELDYFYLTLAVAGIIGSVNRIDQVSGRFSKVDILAPIVLVTAVVDS
jgi:hypothetical protein